MKNYLIVYILSNPLSNELFEKSINAKFNNEKTVTLWGTGSPIREWLYVDDAAEIIIESLKIKTFIEPVNIGVGKGITVLELAELVKEIVGFKGSIKLDTGQVLFSLQGYRPAAVGHAGLCTISILRCQQGQQQHNARVVG